MSKNNKKRVSERSGAVKVQSFTFNSKANSNRSSRFKGSSVVDDEAFAAFEYFSALERMGVDF